MGIRTEAIEPSTAVVRMVVEEAFVIVAQVIMQTWDFAGQQMYYNMAHVSRTQVLDYVVVELMPFELYLEK